MGVSGRLPADESTNIFSVLRMLSVVFVTTEMAGFGTVESPVCGGSMRSKLLSSPSVTVIVVMIVLELSVLVLMLVSIDALLLPMTMTLGTTWSRVVVFAAAAMAAAALPEDMRPVLKCSRRSALVAVEMRSSVGPDCELTVIFW